MKSQNVFVSRLTLLGQNTVNLRQDQQFKLACNWLPSEVCGIDAFAHIWIHADILFIPIIKRGLTIRKGHECRNSL